VDHNALHPPALTGQTVGESRTSLSAA